MEGEGSDSCKIACKHSYSSVQPDFLHLQRLVISGHLVTVPLRLAWSFGGRLEKPSRRDLQGLALKRFWRSICSESEELELCGVTHSSPHEDVQQLFVAGAVLCACWGCGS